MTPCIVAMNKPIFPPLIHFVFFSKVCLDFFWVWVIYIIFLVRKRGIGAMPQEEYYYLLLNLGHAAPIQSARIASLTSMGGVYNVVTPKFVIKPIFVNLSAT